MSHYKIKDFFDWQLGDEFLNQLHSPNIFFEKILERTKLTNFNANNLTTENTVETFFGNNFLSLYIEKIDEFGRHKNSVTRLIATKIIEASKEKEFLEFIMQSEYKDNYLIKQLLLEFYIDKKLFHYIKNLSLVKKEDLKYYENYLNTIVEIKELINFDNNVSIERFLDNVDIFKNMSLNSSDISQLISLDYVKKYNEQLMKNFYEKIVLGLDNIKGTKIISNDMLSRVLSFLPEQSLEYYLKNCCEKVISDYNEEKTSSNEHNVVLFSINLLNKNEQLGKKYMSVLLSSINNKKIILDFYNRVSRSNLQLIIEHIKENTKKDVNYLKDKKLLNNYNSNLSEVIAPLLIEHKVPLNKDLCGNNNYLYSLINWIRTDIHLLSVESLDFLNSQNKILMEKSVINKLVYNKAWSLLVLSLKYKANRANINNVIEVFKHCSNIPEKLFKTIVVEYSSVPKALFSLIKARPQDMEKIIEMLPNKELFVSIFNDYMALSDFNDLSIENKEKISLLLKK